MATSAAATAAAAAALLHRLPFSRSTTPLQAATYLLGISLFSITFLVFLNSSISFVITDRIGVHHGVGDIVGTLGFVDELVALVACPVWGLVSDRLGVRLVAVVGYVVLALGLVLSAQARNVYPQLLLARALFAVGATAAATMVTAILPSLTDDGGSTDDDNDDDDKNNNNNSAGAAAADVAGPVERYTDDGDNDDTEDTANALPTIINSSPRRARSNPHDSAISIESQLTITPERFAESLRRPRAPSAPTPASKHATSGLGSTTPGAGAGKPSQLAGLVGLFTGCGALIALVLFLPLPASFARKDGVTMADAVARAFYVVALVALLVAGFVFVGLRGLRGEQGKGWRMLLGRAPSSTSSASSESVPYWHLLRDAVRLGLTDPDIGLGYLGGFVARASTVAMSLFIPLFVNSFFIGHGFCQGAPNDPSPELKKECRAAYVLASILTGVAQLTGLLCAPLFGYLAGRRGQAPRRSLPVNLPVLVATACGIAGYIAFAQLASPEPSNVDGRGGSPAVFVIAMLLGISQIGAIVCSLGSLGQGVLAATRDNDNGDNDNDGANDADGAPGVLDDLVDVGVPNVAEDAQEGASLLVHESGGDGVDNTSSAPGPAASPAASENRRRRLRLKGSIAGVYSWCGGAAILLLTKLGGYLFDHSHGAPFYLMAAFNAVLLGASLGVDAWRMVKAHKR